MLLNSTNCSYPPFWGKEILVGKNGWVIQNQTLEVEVPKEFDFFNLWCNKDPQNAKYYYKT